MMVDTLCHRCHTSQVWPAGTLCEPCQAVTPAAAAPASASR